MIVLVIVNIVFFVLLVYFNKKEVNILNSKIQEQEKDIKKVFTQLSGILDICSKNIKVLQQVKATTNKEIGKIVHDLDDLYKFSLKETKAIDRIMKMHNDLVDTTFDGFRDIYCDLNECDCSICNYKGYCTKEDNIDSVEDIDNDEDEDEPHREDNRIIIDPKNNNSFNKLKTAMIKSGVPQEVVDNYISYIKEAYNKTSNTTKDRTIEVVWSFGKGVKGGLIKHQFIKNDKSEEKPIDPHSKIVKTLNELYKRKDS